ncbi:MAG: IclR family transcriptional regulator [Deltaproteobacteria bacterium SG8_13]|nr:MAG: IclR family transcriptional regulator [Deltaproteobacteria bacterium SG8_13]
MVEKYTAPTVGKTFRILRSISRNPQGQTISELSQQLGISKSTVHGISAALEELGAISRAPDTRRFRLGTTLFELGRAAYSRIDVKDTARPFMEQLMRKTRESVFLGIRNRQHVTILDTVESTNDLKITSPIGTTIPLLAGAVGKVFLAEMEAKHTTALLHQGLPRFTERSITDPVQYSRQLRQTRETGHAVDDEEYISGVRAVAAPIRSDGNLLAAIWVVGFTPSLNDQKLPAVARETIAAAEEIGAAIARKGALEA